MDAPRADMYNHPLEAVDTSLPAAVEFDAHFDASVDLLGPSLVVYAELENIPIAEIEWPALHPRSRQANMIEECPAG